MASGRQDVRAREREKREEKRREQRGKRGRMCIPEVFCPPNPTQPPPLFTCTNDYLEYSPSCSLIVERLLSLAGFVLNSCRDEAELCYANCGVRVEEQRVEARGEETEAGLLTWSHSLTRGAANELYTICEQQCLTRTRRAAAVVGCRRAERRQWTDHVYSSPG